MASRILDMGDVLTLIEQAQRAFDADQAEAMAAKFAADEDFTFDDFLQQMAALKNMGSLKKMLGMLPAWGSCATSSRTSTSARWTGSRPSSGR